MDHRQSSQVNWLFVVGALLVFVPLFGAIRSDGDGITGAGLLVGVLGVALIVVGLLRRT